MPRPATQRTDFRTDLLEPLAFDVLTVLPVRERTGDILKLAEHLVVTISRKLSRELFAGFTEHAGAALMHHERPDNVRELKNMVGARFIVRLAARRLMSSFLSRLFPRSGHPSGRARPHGGLVWNIDACVM